MPYFNENSTLTDVEIDGLIDDLRLKAREKKLELSLVNITRYNWAYDFGHKWNVTATFKDGPEPISASGKLLHEALNSFLDKLKPPADLESILGYRDIKIKDAN